MRTIKLRGALAIVAALLVLTAPQAMAQTTSAPSTRADRDAAVLEMLHTTVLDAKYDRIDLDKVLDDLRDKFNLNIYVAWDQLEARGLRRDHRIELDLKQVSLATLLDILLADRTGLEEGGFVVRNGVIMVGVGSPTRVDTVLRHYRITDLIESGYGMRRFANTPVLGLELSGREFVGGEERKVPARGFGGGGAGGGGTVFDDPEDLPARLSSMERMQAIVDLIASNVEPQIWDFNGGSMGSISVYESTLLVRCTLPVHEQVETFLNMLRSAAPLPVDADAAVVHVRADRAVELRKKLGERFPVVTTAQVNELLLNANSEGVLFRGSTSGFNGARLWFSALTQRDVLNGMTPTVGDGVNAFQPILATSTAGLELIVLPLLSADGKSFDLDVQMAWIPTVQVDERAVTLASPADGTVDVTERSMRSVSTTVRVNAEQAIVLTIPNQLSANGTAAEWEDWLVLSVRQRD